MKTRHHESPRDGSEDVPFARVIMKGFSSLKAVYFYDDFFTENDPLYIAKLLCAMDYFAYCKEFTNVEMCFETGAGDHVSQRNSKEQSHLTNRVGVKEASSESVGLYHVYMNPSNHDYIGEWHKYEDKVKINKCHQWKINRATIVSDTYIVLAVPSLFYELSKCCS